MGLHGFVPYTDLVAGENFGNSISFALKANEETLKCYPFQFTYRVTYTLEESKLFVTYTVENHDSKTMCFGIGGHPGFHMPIDGTLAFEDYRLTFEKPCTASRITIGGQKGGVTGEVAYPIETGCMELRHDLFDNGPIVLKNSGHSIVISSDKSPKTIKVSYPDMPYVGPARTEAYSVGHLAGVGSAAHNKGCKAGLQCLIDQRGQPLYHRPLGVRKNAATIVDSLFHAQTVYL